MGFFNRVQNWLQQTGSKIYNGIKNGVSTGYNAVKNIGHTIGSISEGIDGFLSQARSLPVVGALAQAIQSNPLYNEVRSGIATANNAIDTAGQIGDQVAGVLDKVIPPVQSN